jgi:LysR family transcriptional regulator of abg operon
MKLHHLRAVGAIAEQGSLRGAARHLRVAQPPLTRGLSELERELGAPLFERRPKGMIATQLGAVFVRRAVRILNDVRMAQEEFAQMHGAGAVVIGLSSVEHILFLPKVLISAKISESAPACS